MRTLLFPLIILLLTIHNVYAQKTNINRNVAQKNYDGYNLLQDKKYEEALKIFDSAIADDPEAYFIYQNRAVCRLNLEDTIGAISDFKTNIRLEPENTESKYALGNIYKKQTDSVNAAFYFGQAIAQADEEFSQIKLKYMNNFLGNYYSTNEKYDSALVCFNRVKIYDPANSSVFINSAVCYFQLDSLDQFCTDLEQAFILGGDVSCFALNSYCKGCSHLIEQRGGNVDTLSLALDMRLRGILPDTLNLQNFFSKPEFDMTARKEVTVYFNDKWQVCLPAQAAYYRTGFWQAKANFFVDGFTDYYADGKLMAKGSISANKLNGNYERFYSNGTLKVKGKFSKGFPVGTWTWFLETGKPDYTITFSFDTYTIDVINTKNPNYKLNSGTGKFSFVVDEWAKNKITLEGEMDNFKKTGKWKFKRNNEVLISEQYKDGDFKQGYILSPFGQMNINSPYLDGSFLTPAYLNEVERLDIVSHQAAEYHSFIGAFEY